MRYLCSLYSLPSWLFVRSLVLPVLPPTHAWYGRNFTLLDWHEHATWLTHQFSFVMWYLLGMLTYLGVTLH